MIEFIGLRAKVYSIKSIPLDEDRREGQKQACAGVKRSLTKKHLSHKRYKEVLFGKEGEDESPKDLLIRQNLIRSKAHKVSTISQIKVGLSAYDDKR